MPYDFTDINQVQQFKRKAASLGYSQKEADDYVNNMLGQIQKVNTIKTSQMESAQKAKEATGIQPKDEFGRKMLNARTASLRAMDFLDAGAQSGPIATRVGKVKEFFGVADTGTDYRQALDLAASQAFNALAGTTQSPQELKRLASIVPKTTDQEAVARRKLQTLIAMLDEQMGVQGVDVSKLRQPGIDTMDVGVKKTSMNQYLSPNKQ